MRTGRGIFLVGELLLFLAAISDAAAGSDLFFARTWLRKNNLLDSIREPRPAEILDLRRVPYLPEWPEDDYEPENAEGQDGEQRLSRNDRSLLPEYSSLCETVTRKVELINDPDYEYQPPHYHEVFCKSYSLMDDEPQKSVGPSKQKCAHPSFHCVQRSRTLFMVRRRWEAECWEPMTKVVASGCDCMWPVSTLGDVNIHYTEAG